MLSKLSKRKIFNRLVHTKNKNYHSNNYKVYNNTHTENNYHKNQFTSPMDLATLDSAKEPEVQN